MAECNDYTDLSPWAGDSLYWACDVGILGWAPGGRLAPFSPLSFQELPGALARFSETWVE